MKKTIIYIIASIVLLCGVVAGALLWHYSGSTSSDGTTAPSDVPQNDTTIIQTDEKKEEKQDEDKKDKKKTKNTLMIYMIGSDLESSGGAGSDDLKEIEESGIDLKTTNVVIYAGGSPYWHNELDASQISVLELTKDGFETVATENSASMGSAECLSKFLDYGYKNYPAEKYALILWNHGNGPVIGYGKDMLFGEDSLTLAEMRTAMAKSPFSGANRLEWVGFDACLMASAELACTWSPYAKYLVSSQEIEPSFGWDYDVFGNYGKVNTKEFLYNLIDGYINECVSYFDRRGYDNREATLSCMDLSYAGELNAAINNLFGKASGDLEAKYNQIVRERVETRAFGRASTGSEYDLIDLMDMANQLSDLYPEETKAIADLLGKMVIKNGNNTTGSHGLSLYYPFYNKYSYEKSWGETYSGLNVFANYGTFLDKYKEIWLKDDKMDSYTSANTPVLVDGSGKAGNFIIGEKSRYALQLTPEQNETFAEGKFYILKHYSGEVYHPVMTSSNVVNVNGVLYADYSGKAIFVKTVDGKRMIPQSIEHDTVGNISRYSVWARGINENEDDLIDFNFALNNNTEELKLSAITTRAAKDSSRSEVSGGKLKEYDFDYWSSYSFFYFDYKYLGRYESGLIRPISQWIEHGAAAMWSFTPEDDGMQFVYEDLEAGTYYIMFEITDTQGNKYCSELLSIEGKYKEEKAPLPVNNINWNSGDKVKLAESNGVTIYLEKRFDALDDRHIYAMTLENKNDFNVFVKYDDLLCNGNIALGNVYLSDEYESEELDRMYATEVELGAIKEINKLSGTLVIHKKDDNGTILSESKVNVDITGEAKLDELASYYKPFEITAPYLDALAEEQLLYEDEELKMTLIGFGKFNSGRSNGSMICIENKSSEYRRIDDFSFVLNGKSVGTMGNIDGISLSPGSKAYSQIGLDTIDLGDNKIKAIENMKISFAVYDTEEDFIITPLHTQIVPVELKEAGKNNDNQTGEHVIFYESGVKITVTGYEVEEPYSDETGIPTWYAIVENENDFAVEIRQYKSNGCLVNCKVNAKSSTYAAIKYYGEESITNPQPDQYSLTINVFNDGRTKLIHASETIITLHAQEEEKNEDIEINWQSGERIKIFEGEGVAVYLKKISDDYYGALYEMEAENNNDFGVEVYLYDLIVNENVQVRSGGDMVGIYGILPNSKASAKLYSIHKVTEGGKINEINSMSGELVIEHDETSAKLVEKQKIVVNMSGRAKINVFKELKNNNLTPKGARVLANEQVILENENLRVTLIAISEEGICLQYENLSSKPQVIGCEMVAVNDVSFGNIHGKTVLPGCVYYQTGYVFDGVNYDEVEKVDFLVCVWQGQFSSGKPHISEWVSIKLAQPGTAPEFVPGEDVVFDEAGVKIICDSSRLYHYIIEDTYYPMWNVTIINNNDYDIYIADGDNPTVIGGLGHRIGAHQRATAQIYPWGQVQVPQVTFNVEISDIYCEKVLHTSKSGVTLIYNESEKTE